MCGNGDFGSQTCLDVHDFVDNQINNVPLDWRRPGPTSWENMKQIWFLSKLAVESRRRFFDGSSQQPVLLWSQNAIP